MLNRNNFSYFAEKRSQSLGHVTEGLADNKRLWSPTLKLKEIRERG